MEGKERALKAFKINICKKLCSTRQKMKKMRGGWYPTTKETVEPAFINWENFGLPLTLRASFHLKRLVWSFFLIGISLCV